MTLPTNVGISLLFFLALGIPAASQVGAQREGSIAGEVTDLVGVVINEVELNPRGSDMGREWVELYNPSEVDVNISDFEIRTSFKSATIQLPSNSEIEANGTYVVELDRQLLFNIAESLALINGSGEMIDRTPSLVDRSDDGRTWQRIPDGNDEWKFATGTKGELNEPDELNNPDEQANATHSARSGSMMCQGTAGCAEGIAIRIVDGDTLYVKVNATVYKVELVLTSAPSIREEGYTESTSFTRSLCLGSNVLVDQDDELLTSDTSVLAVVYCESNLNSELLDSGHASLNMNQCKTSEFANQRWAREHGC